MSWILFPVRSLLAPRRVASHLLRALLHGLCAALARPKSREKQPALVNRSFPRRIIMQISFRMYLPVVRVAAARRQLTE